MADGVRMWSSYQQIIVEEIHKAPTLVRLILLFQKPKQYTYVIKDTKDETVYVTNYYKTHKGKVYYYNSYCTIERKEHNAKNK